MQYLVLVGPGREHDGANATTDGSPNQTEPRTLQLRLEKISRRPAMWWLAPLSRYQPSSLSSLEPVLRKAWARGSSMCRMTTVGAVQKVEACAFPLLSSVSSSRKSCARNKPGSSSSACACAHTTAIASRMAAVLGPVACSATIEAGVVTGHLAFTAGSFPALPP